MDESNGTNMEADADAERRRVFAERHLPKNQIRGCRVQMNLTRAQAEKFWPYGTGNSDSSVMDGLSLPEDAELILIETDREIGLEPVDIVSASWLCEDSGWAEGDGGPPENFSHVRFGAENAVLLRLKHIEEARTRGFEQREMRRAVRAEHAAQSGNDEDSDDEEDGDEC